MQVAVSQHGHCGDYIRFPASGCVFQEAGVFSPMVFDLYTAPVIAYDGHPLPAGEFIRWNGTDVIGDFRFILFSGRLRLFVTGFPFLLLLLFLCRRFR